MTITSSEIRFLAARSHIETGAAQIDTKTLLTIATHIDAQAARIAEQQAVIDQRNGECDRLINELAALREQEPLCYITPDTIKAFRCAYTGSATLLPDTRSIDPVPLFMRPVPPATVAMPDELPKQLEVVGYNDGWNACRAEVLRLNSGSKSND